MPESKILIVDDKHDLREVLGDRLEANGYEVRSVPTARACYASVAEDPPDLILLDLQMPDISGMDALRELKARYPETAALMITASTGRDVAWQCLEMGLPASS